MLPLATHWRNLIRLPHLSTVLALVTFVVLVVRAVTTVVPYWDTLAYHWPFAARLAGLCDPECYSLTFDLEKRYEGFPLLLHAVQGLLWRLTGTPGSVELVYIALLLALCAYLKYRFAVPLAWSWLAFIAIPEVQIQLTSSYIDVPVNAAVTLALMVLLRMLVQPAADQRLDVAIALAALGIAVQSKFQVVPISLALWLVIVVLATRNPAMIRTNHRFLAATVLGLSGAIVLLPKLIMNFVNFGNPFYPVAVVFGGLHFPGVESMAAANSLPNALVDWPGPMRWLASVLEFDAFRGRPLPWTIDQGDVPQSSPSFRMGGYFVPYVLGLLALIGWNARSTNAARWPAALVLSLSVICASMPMSHELRYNLFWILALVSCALVLAHSSKFANPQHLVQRQVTHGLVLIAGLSVVLMTGGAYLRLDGVTLRDLLQETEATVARIPEGGTLCILNGNRYGFLYASVFHPARHYHTKSLGLGDEADCTMRLDIDHPSTPR
jgi:hypothetical protein